MTPNTHRRQLFCSHGTIFLRATLALLFVQMLGTLTPLLLFPAEKFDQFPFAPSLEGQYIIKNAVLISGAVILGAKVAAVIDPEPDAPCGPADV